MQEITSETTAAHWRHYADDLTAGQVVEIAEWEQQPDGGLGSSMRRSALLMAARDYARRNRWARDYADVHPPIDASHAGDWDPVHDIEFPARYFEGARWPRAHIGGLQDANGSVRERWITVDTDTDDLDAGTARALARFLLAAADELEQMAFREAVAGLDIEEGITWQKAAKQAAAPPLGAGRRRPALVCAYADTFGGDL
jgi:hypothetical protein